MRDPRTDPPPPDEAPKDGPRRVTVDGQTWECTQLASTGATTWRLAGSGAGVYLHVEVGDLFRAWLEAGQAFTVRGGQ